MAEKVLIKPDAAANDDPLGTPNAPPRPQPTSTTLATRVGSTLSCRDRHGKLCRFHEQFAILRIIPASIACGTSLRQLSRRDRAAARATIATAHSTPAARRPRQRRTAASPTMFTTRPACPADLPPSAPRISEA